MAKIDEIKELIGFLKVLFATFIALDVSLVAWLSKNHSLNSEMWNYSTLALIIFFSLGIIFTVKSILKNIKKLKDL